MFLTKSRSWIWLILTWLILVLLVDPRGDFPLNDDWQYAAGVRSLMQEGRLRFLGVFSPIVLTQVLWAYLFSLPFGFFSFELLRVSTLLLGIVAVLLLYALARHWGVARPPALFLAFVLLLNPLFFVLSFSFMTDVPFLACCLASVYGYWAFRESRSGLWLVVALLFSVLAFYIRQPAAVLPVAYGLHWYWERGYQRSALWPSLALVSFGPLLWLSWELAVRPGLGLAEFYRSDTRTFLLTLLEQPVQFSGQVLLRLLKSALYIGWFAIPLLPIILSGLRWSRRHWLLAAVISAGLVLLAWWMDKPFPFGGNVFYNFGLGPETLHDVYHLELANTPRLPLVFMLLAQWLAGLSVGVLGAVIVRRWREEGVEARSQLLLVGLIIGLYLPLMTIVSYFDRYVLLPLALVLPGLLTNANFQHRVHRVIHRWPQSFPSPLLLQKGWNASVFRNDTAKHSLQVWLSDSSVKALATFATGRPIRWPAIALLLLFGWFSLCATHDYLAWNRARWRAWDWLSETRGATIQQVDGGYELNGWLNYYDRDPATVADDRSFWWVTDDRYIIAFGYVPGYERIHRETFARWLWWSRGEVGVWERE